MAETTVAYATRLREKAHDCDFGTNCDERILEHLIQTIENQVLIQKCISKSWTLQEFLMDAGQIEDISLQMRDMKIGPDNKDIEKVEESTPEKEEWKGCCSVGPRKCRGIQWSVYGCVQ